MAEVVGTAYVRIRAVTTKLAADIADGIDRGVADAKPDIEASGEASGKAFTDGFIEDVKSKFAKRLEESIKEAGEESGRKFSRSFSEVVIPEIRSATKSISEDDVNANWFRRFGSRMAGLFHSAWRSRSNSETGATSNSLKTTFGKIFKSLQKFQLPLPFWLPMFGMGIIAGAAKLVAFYILGLVGYIGTLVEISVAGGAVIGGAFLQAAAGLGILFAAFRVQTPELEAFKSELQGVNAQWKNLAVVTQKTLLPGIKEAYETLSGGLVPVFTEIGPLLGEIGGNAAKAIAEVLTTERATRMWREFARSTAATTQNVGRLGAGLARILVPLLETVNPLAVRFTDSIATMVDRWGALLERASDSGALTTFLTESYLKAEQFFRALGDLLAGLWNVLRIGSDVIGGSAFDTLARFADKFRDFTNSLEGQNKIRKFFEEAKPVMEEVNGLMADIIRAFGRSIGEGGTGSQNIVTFLQTLRYDILPAMEVALTRMSRAMDQANFDQFMVAITELLTVVFEIQFLTPILQTVTLLLNGLVTVLNTPIVGDLVKWLFVVGTVAGFTAKFLSPVFKLLGGIGKGVVFLSKTPIGAKFFATIAGHLGGILPGLAKLGGIIAGIIGTLTSGPVLAVAGIIAAIVGAIVGAYFAFDGVRKVVDQWWDSIQRVWTLLTDLFNNFSWGKLGELFLAVMDLFAKTIGLLPTILWEALWGLGELIVRFFQNLPGWIGTALGFLGEKLGQLGSFLWEWIQNAVPTALEWLGNLATTVLEWVISLPGKIWEFIQLAIPALFQWIANAIPQVLYWLGYALGFIIGWAVRIPFELGKLLVQGAIALWSWISNAFPQILSWLGTVLSAVWEWVSGFVAELPGRIWGAAVAIWNWIVQAIPQVLGFLGELAGKVWSWVVNFVSELPGRIAGAIGAISNWVRTAASELPGKLAEFAGRLRDWAVELPGNLIGWIGDIGGRMLEIGRAVVEGIWNGISDMGQWIQDLIGDFAGGIIDGFLGAFGINSPAKVMIPIGVGVGEGIGVGLEKQLPVLNRQVNRQVNDLYSSAINGLDSGSARSGTATIADAIRLLAESTNTDVRVYIGDTELRDIVDTQVDRNSRQQASMLIGRRF